MRRVGPSAPDRAAGIAVALALHAAVLALAGLCVPVGAPALAPPRRPSWIPVRIVRLAHAFARHGRSPQARGVPGPVAMAPVRVGEREIILQPSGVTMTIEGGADAGVPAVEEPSPPRPRPADERWLRMDVWVGAPPSAPHPSRWCAPARPTMPEEPLEGRVEVVYEVDPEGLVGDIEFQGPASHLLAHAVRVWLRGCLFDPAQQDGHRVAARVRQTFVFTVQ